MVLCSWHVDFGDDELVLATTCSRLSRLPSGPYLDHRHPSGTEAAHGFVSAWPD